MPSISLTLPVSGNVITAALHSGNYSALSTLLNGGLDDSNISSLSYSKLNVPSLSIPIAKINASGTPSSTTFLRGDASWQTVAAGPTITRALTPPGSPADGDIWYYVDSLTATTVQWAFRWNTGSSNTDKWEFIGGDPAFVEVTTAEATSSVTYTALTTAGPNFALPRAGVYIVEQGFTLTQAANGAFGLMSYDIGGTGAVDADATQGTHGNTLGKSSHMRRRVKAGLTAVTLTSKYRGDGTNAATFQDRWISVTPVRVS